LDMNRNLVLSLVCVMLAIVPALCVLAAENVPAGAWDKPVDLMLRSARLGMAIDSLLRDTGINYRIDPDVLDIQITDLSIQRQPLRAALADLLKATGTVQSLDKSGMVSIGLGDVWSKKVSVDFEGVALRDALDTLFAKAGTSGWTIDKGVPDSKVTYAATDVPFIDALGAVLRPAAAKFGWQHIIAGDPWQRIIDVDMKDMPLSDAIDMLFKDTGVSYTLDPAVQQLKVTAVLKNIPLDQALKAVLKAAGAVCRVENSVYIIGLRPIGPGEPQTRLRPVLCRGCRDCRRRRKGSPGLSSSSM
jgi:hypothetical protein